jgi:hypothetical protein
MVSGRNPSVLLTLHLSSRHSSPRPARIDRKKYRIKTTARTHNPECVSQVILTFANDSG